MFFSFASVAAMFRRSAPKSTAPDVDFAFLSERNIEPARTVEAAYDAAQTTPDNRRHWRWADALSAKSANGPWVRSIIRQRARYEADNNPLIDGILNTLANDMIGHGPVLQINSPVEDFNKAAKLAWERWTKAIRLWSKLREARRSKAVDGEAFLLLVYDPTVAGPVKWNVRVIECDRVTTPDMPWEDPRRTDGILFDEHGNPIEYHILRAHPGDQGVNDGYWFYDPIPAQYVLHWFNRKRPGQLRGVSELAPQLGTVADLRRFAKATVKKKECQAEIHGFIEQPSIGGPTNGDGINAWAEFDVEMGTWMALPPGGKPIPFESTESSDPFTGYKRESVSDIGRPWGMSYNVAACNSSDSNFSSGKLDQRLYGRHMELEQDEATCSVLDPLFRFFMFAVQNGRGSTIPDDSAFDWEHSWSWPMLDDPDPAKTSTADASDIETGIISVRTVQMRRKVDPDLEERRCAEENGMTVEQYRQARGQRLFSAKAPAPGQPTAPPDRAPTKPAQQEVAV